MPDDTASVNAQQDSYRPVRTLVVFRDPLNRVIGGEGIFEAASSIGVGTAKHATYNDMVQSVTLRVLSSGRHRRMADAWTCDLTLFDAGVADLQMLSLVVGAGCTVEVAVGYENDWQKRMEFVGRIVKQTLSLNDGGMTLTFFMVTHTEYEMRAKNRAIVPLDVPANTKSAANIVRELTQRITPNARTVIQDDPTPFPYPVNWDASTSVFRYIPERIIPHTPPAGGKPYRFFVDKDGTVHFHTDDYLPNTAGPWPSFQYRHQEGNVLSVEVNVEALSAAILGYTSSTSSSVDSATGETSVKTDVRGLPGAGQPSTALPGESAVPNPGTVPRIPLTSTDPRLRAAELAEIMQRLRTRFIQFSMTVIGTNEIDLFGLLNFDYRMPNGQAHFISGTYRVGELEHHITDGGWTTHVEAWREGTSPDDPSTKVPPLDKDASVPVPTPPPVQIAPKTANDAVDAEFRSFGRMSMRLGS